MIPDVFDQKLRNLIASVSSLVLNLPELSVKNWIAALFLLFCEFYVLTENFHVVEGLNLGLIAFASFKGTQVVYDR